MHRHAAQHRLEHAGLPERPVFSGGCTIGSVLPSWRSSTSPCGIGTVIPQRIVVSVHLSGSGFKQKDRQTVFIERALWATAVHQALFLPRPGAGAL